MDKRIEQPYSNWSFTGGSGRVEPVSNEYRSQATRGEAPPRKYVGRSQAGASSEPGQAGERGGAPRYGSGGSRPAAAKPMPTASTQAAPWSLRLVVAVSLVVTLAIGLRVTSILALPVDPPVGAEATHAVFAKILSGQIGGSLDPARYFPPPAPWFGDAPALPSAGLPLFGWLSAAAMQLLGAGDWSGRAVSVFFGLLTGLLLFGVVRRTAGARAGLYALLFFSISPLSVELGQQFSPAMTMLAVQALAVLALCRWRQSAIEGRSAFAFGFMLGTGALGALVDPGSIFLALPAAYLMLWPGEVDPRSADGLAQKPPVGARSLWSAFDSSPNRGKFLGYVAVLVGCAALWRLMTSGADASVALGIGDGGGGIGTALATLLQGGAYAQIVGAIMEKLLTILGALLVLGGLLRGARRPFSLLFHVWLLAGVAHVLADASRIGRHDDVLLPLLLPCCALAGLGCAWAGSLPARVWLAVTEQRRESDSAYTVSPHTSWLLDLPEELAAPSKNSRPQAQVALSKSIAQRAQLAGAKARRAWVMGIGNFAVLGALAVMLLTGWQSAQARLQPSIAAIELTEIGRQVRDATQPGSRLIIAGPSAPELFYASERTGWALSEDDFSIARVQTLQRDGAGYLLSADQDWLGHHPDYRGLLTNYSVLRLGRGFVLFDLNAKPAQNDRSYFLESGHTLGGEFRRFWLQNGDARKLGYPISEELEEVNPLDGQKRTAQYFERAVLEYHPEFAGAANAVMLAAVGRWVTMGRDFPRVAPFKNTADHAYFPETGHSVKEAFLLYWQREGGLAKFGYPISEELPEISNADGKVYTVQYFERARFEWHPTDAGTPNEVQLGLIGKQALELSR